MCFAPVLSMAEAPSHPHNVHRGTFVEVAGITQPGPAPRFGRTPGEIRRPPAHAGQHTDEVLTEVRVPAVPGAGWAFEKFNRRAQDWAIVGVAATIPARDSPLHHAASRSCSVAWTMKSDRSSSASRASSPSRSLRPVSMVRLPFGSSPCSRGSRTSRR